MFVSNSPIPTYNLTVYPDDLDDLQIDIWCDNPVPAYLFFNKNKFDVDIAYRGSHTRKYKKKSYRIQFINPRRFEGSREIHLNAEFVDNSMIRNKLSLDFMNAIGVLSPKSQHIGLNLNSNYEGLYLQLESVDDLFLKKRGLPPGPIYYAVTNQADFSLIQKSNKKEKHSYLDGYKRKFGTIDHDSYLGSFIQKLNTSNQDEFVQTISQYLNTDKYLRWLAGAVCTQNYDGFNHNYALYCNSKTELFEIIPWDYNGTFGRNWNGKEMSYNYVPIYGYNTLSSKLLSVPQFKQQYSKILEEILETAFTVEFFEPQIQYLHQNLRPYVPLDPYKKKEITNFDQEPEYLLKFISKRNEYLCNQLSQL